MVEAALGREATRDSELWRETRQKIIELQPLQETHIHEVFSGNTGGQELSAGRVFWHSEITPGTLQPKGNQCDFKL